MRDGRPNLVFLMTDHQRADSLGMVQSGVEVTPNLNRLAERGTIFQRAYNTCPLCVPARTALATGKYPTTNGVITNDWKGRAAKDHTTLHELLHQHGFEVGHVGVNHVRVRPALEERLPFAHWEDGKGYAAYLRSSDAEDSSFDRTQFQTPVVENHGTQSVECRYSSTRTAVWPGPAEDFKDLFWCRQAVDFVKRKRDKPFALFLCLWAPHPPLRVPEPYASLFDPDKLDLPSNVGCPCEGEPKIYRKGVPAQLADGVSPEEWRRVWAAHLGLVNLADTGIGHVLDAGLEIGGQDDTLIVFTADHGEHLGQHGMYQKMEMYEQAIRVPLVFAGAGIAGQAVREPVSHLDVMPTLLELLGIQCPDDLDGVTLASTLQKSVKPPQRPVFVQYSGNPVVGDIRRCVISEGYKYVWAPPDCRELYDVEADPLEMTNLAASAKHQDILRRLHEECRKWGVKHADAEFGGGT
ncbi:MAG: sulfatase-like hydrolase/transferase [Lentisphaeria bacterium]|nr:sulfatase-like hydrolase/transferase [Lentisphaeria bacterium]